MTGCKPQQLDPQRVVQAQRLLYDGVPKGEIRRQLGMGKGTLNSIQRGELDAEAINTRCGGCGGLLEVTPCIACDVRRQAA